MGWGLQEAKVGCAKSSAAARHVQCLTANATWANPSLLAAWTVDEKLRTFVAAPTDSPAGPPTDAWRLRPPAEQQQQAQVVQQVGLGWLPAGRHAGRCALLP